jgi:hypothetical protein
MTDMFIERMYGGGSIERSAAKEIARLRDCYDQLVGEKERYRRVVQDFANEANCSQTVGCLQWTAKRNAIEYAQSVLAGKE